MTTGLLRGNCLEQLLLIPDESVDSIVTDPPYELGFMNKGWDSSGIAYNTELWAQCLRVLKPGGHLLAFGGSRTYHRIAVAIEDAGFEVRDSIHWTYGSGFPKSMNVGKSIEGYLTTGSSNKNNFKNLNGERLERGDWGLSKAQQAHGVRDTNYDETAGETRLGKLEATTTEAQNWEGWGTALKPSHEPIVVARKPLVGTVANNILTYGTGGINIDGTRVGGEERTYDPTMTSGNFETTGGGKNEKSGTATVEGRWPANTILTHSPDCASVNDEWQCAEGCPVPVLDEQSGIRPGGVFPAVRGKSEIGAFGAGGTHKDKPNQARNMGDSGGASRYFTQTAYEEADFPPFIYQAKASTKERNAGLGDLETKQTVGGGGLTEAGDKYGSIKAPGKNFHPTVKPISLMRHLIRLVTPPNGLVLDPFLGSGTTAVAAVLENCRWVGCELTEEYWPIIEGRINWAQSEVLNQTPTQESLF